jgi:RNA binding exosome subunit
MCTSASWTSKKQKHRQGKITERFAKVFDQAYTRFLDLQKAEAQAREAQIQLSLERIRAKAMAMQHSDELGFFLKVVFEQFDVLNLSPVSCQLSFFDIENNRSTFRMTGKNGAVLIATQEIDLDASPIWKQKVEGWKSGHPNDVDVLYIPFENLPEIAEIFKEIRSKLPEDDLPQIADFPNGQYVVEGYCKYGYLGYCASKPPSDEEKEITRRIANEFGNVYQRFIDLQKAEAQAREAQIQLSLERIRAKAMAMQHTDELSEFLTVLFEQFEVLNLKPVFCHLSFFDIENNRFTYRMTGRTGAAVIATQEIDFEATPIWKQNVEDWKSGHPYQVGGLYIPKERIPEMTEIFNEILEKLPEDERPLMEDFPDGQYVVDGYCKYGYLGYSAGRPPSDEEKEITRRIANEFGNVYQRFLDLEKAEAQAKEVSDPIVTRADQGKGNGHAAQR